MTDCPLEDAEIHLDMEAFNKILDAVREALIITDREGNVLVVNKRTLELYGISREQALGLKITDDLLVSVSSPGAVISTWEKLRTGGEQLFECAGLRPNASSTFEAQVFLSTIKINRERFILVAVRDVSAWVKAERELTEAKERIQKLHEFVLKLEHIDNEQQVYELGIEIAEKNLGFYRSVISTARLNVLIPQAISQEVPRYGAQPCLISEGIVGKTYRTQKAWVIDDMQTHPEADLASDRYHSLVSVPVGDIGVFQCAAEKIGVYDEGTVEIVEILTAHIAAAVERIRTKNSLQKKRKEAEQLASEYEVIFESSQDGLFLIDVSPDGDFVMRKVNSALQSMAGGIFSGGNSMVSLRKAFSKKSWKRIYTHLQLCCDNKEPTAFEVQFIFQGVPHFFSCRLSPVVKNEQTVQIVGSVRDRTVEMEAERSVRESERKYRTLAEKAKDLIVIVQHNEHKYVNAAAKDILGYEKEELLNSSWLQFIHPTEKERFVANAMKREAGEEVPHIYETVLQHKDGSKIHVEVNVSDISYQGEPAKLIITRDITQRKDSEKRLLYLSSHDQLTGIHNRAYFETELKRLDQQSQLPLSVLMADVNGLKVFNDAFGHQQGDQMLQQIARILQDNCRNQDVAARIGGDEFAIVCPQTPSAEAEELMVKIRQKCGQSAQEFEISLSLGWATKIEPDRDIWEVLSWAEEKMYRDKMLRRDSVRSAIIQSLLNALEEKTMETTQHTRRLENLGRAVARQMGLSKSEINNLALLAKLHDIGKVAISNNVLMKSEPLHPDEWMEIKRHPEIGYRIAQTNVELAPIDEAILYHHEWYNGQGYPRGLKGEEIPLLSRVLAVLDAYDAMTNDRPYREAMSGDEAVEEIKHYSGSQFDPQVVNAFLGVLDGYTEID